MKLFTQKKFLREESQAVFLAAKKTGLPFSFQETKVAPELANAETNNAPYLPHLTVPTIAHAIEIGNAIIAAKKANSDQEHYAYLLSVAGKSPSRKIGIIGGMGPQATLFMMEKFPSQASMLVLMIPHINDRTSALLNPKNTTLSERINNIFQRGSEFLLQHGCCTTLVPCNTAHAFSSRIVGDFSHMINNTVSFISWVGTKKIISMATSGTNQTRIYVNAFQETDSRISVVMPSKDEQEIMMNIIYKYIKSPGRVTDTAVNLYIKLVKNYIDRHVAKGNTEPVFLGWFCTEFPLVGSDWRTEYWLKNHTVTLTDGKSVSYFDMLFTVDPMDVNVTYVCSQLNLHDVSRELAVGANRLPKAKL